MKLHYDIFLLQNCYVASSKMQSILSQKYTPVFMNMGPQRNFKPLFLKCD
jgi:hypothetical protein